MNRKIYQGELDYLDEKGRLMVEHLSIDGDTIRLEGISYTDEFKGWTFGVTLLKTGGHYYCENQHAAQHGESSDPFSLDLKFTKLATGSLKVSGTWYESAFNCRYHGHLFEKDSENDD
jgi:hypothetical protein